VSNAEPLFELELEAMARMLELDGRPLPSSQA
jgi:hypothetical protein